ncbi:MULTISPECIES: DUF6285 domain-containing protein [Noviherbaspirillum]|uniref:DUF6285 domain-containing protein n=1 Tax=Noviherbaspirillum TaxID=1344552 RepID=UPI00124D0763|nr:MULTISPECIES: DUF6285 domain-containing protein [Noviherbaspirillum]
MSEQPSAPELIQAVADFLRDDALPRLDGLTAFHARVAVSLLEIVRREIELGPDADAQQRARLQDLLGSEGGLDALNRELCERIARGEVNAHSPGLMPHLLRTGLAKLAVDQPGYLTYRRLQQHKPEGGQ